MALTLGEIFELAPTMPLTATIDITEVGPPHQHLINLTYTPSERKPGQITAHSVLAGSVLAESVLGISLIITQTARPGFEPGVPVILDQFVSVFRTRVFERKVANVSLVAHFVPEDENPKMVPSLCTGGLCYFDSGGNSPLVGVCINKGT
jgi:hypothetical protein